MPVLYHRYVGFISRKCRFSINHSNGKWVASQSLLRLGQTARHNTRIRSAFLRNRAFVKETAFLFSVLGRQRFRYFDVPLRRNPPFEGVALPHAAEFGKVRELDVGIGENIEPDRP